MELGNLCLKLNELKSEPGQNVLKVVQNARDLELRQSLKHLAVPTYESNRKGSAFVRLDVESHPGQRVPRVGPTHWSVADHRGRKSLLCHTCS